MFSSPTSTKKVNKSNSLQDVGYFFAHGLLTVCKWAKNDSLFKMIGSVLSGDSLPKDKIEGGLWDNSLVYPLSVSQDSKKTKKARSILSVPKRL